MTTIFPFLVNRKGSLNICQTDKHISRSKLFKMNWSVCIPPLACFRLGRTLAVRTASLLHAVKDARGGMPECISLIMKKEKRGALINFTTAPLPCRLLSHTSALPLHTQIHTLSLVNPPATFTHMATHPRTGPIQLCQALWSSAYWWTLPVTYIKLLLAGNIDCRLLLPRHIALSL